MSDKYTLCTLLFPWLFKLVLEYALNRVRSRLRRCSEIHRSSILVALNEEDGSLDEKRNGNQRIDDEDWQHVQGSDAKSNHGANAMKTSESCFVGYFHPFANAGGGGERVLWAAIRATQDKLPKAICVVYTGDVCSNKSAILERVKSRFDIGIDATSIVFLHLEKRRWVVATSFPFFTLFLQSIGSIIVAHEALSHLTPDIFFDTMGYSFSTWYCKFMFPDIPIGSYVHYPFIGTHMVESLGSDAGHGVNAGSGKGLRGIGKKIYWHSLLILYKWTGTFIDVVMTNSSWTQAHMQRIWGSGRQRWKMSSPAVVYPPCSVEEIISQIHLEGSKVVPREKILLCIAQFRPEKNHELLVQAFAEMQRKDEKAGKGSKLVLVGSVRDDTDEKLVYKLRILAKELKIDESVVFKINCPWSDIVDLLQRSWIGVNGMWCEHFGIGVVEYQAAGLISVVNNSGGPKEDIVVDYESGPTGYHASTASEYAAFFSKVLTLPPSEVKSMRARNRASSRRFTTEIFCTQWSQHLDSLMDMRPSRSKAI